LAYMDKRDFAALMGRPSPMPPFIWQLFAAWESLGRSVDPLRLLEYPTWLVEGLQACELAQLKRKRRNLPVKGDAS